MRYFVVTLIVFALFHVPPLHRLEWLNGVGTRAVVAFGIGLLLSGIHHLIFVEHYVRVIPAWIPAQHEVVYLSAVLRMAFGLGVLLPGLRGPATIASLVLLCVVAPANIRIAVMGLGEGQLIDADWFRWLRVALHLSWIGWCGWCLSMLPRS